MVFAFKKAEQAPKPTPVETDVDKIDADRIDADKTEVSEQQSIEKDGDKEDGDKKDENMVEGDNNVEQQDTEMKMEGDERHDRGRQK